MHTCRVYTKDCVDPTHIGRDISSCCYLRMLSYHHHHHWYLWIYPFFVSFSWHQIDSYLEHSNGDTFACAFDALHEPFRNIWLVPLCLVHATRNNKRGENYSTTTIVSIYVKPPLNKPRKEILMSFTWKKRIEKTTRRDNDNDISDVSFFHCSFINM